MNKDIIYAVYKSGEISTNLEENTSDIMFYSKRIIKSTPCTSYSYDDYQITDKDGNEINYTAGKYKIKRIWTSGTAAYYTLNITVVENEREEYTQDFWSDIRYLQPFDAFYPFIPCCQEWDVANPFTVLATLLENLEKYGNKACKVIYGLMREQARLKYDMLHLNIKANFYDTMTTTVEEIVVKEGIEEIKERQFYGFSKLKKITLPVSLQRIGNYAFKEANNLETIICKAPKPPKVFIFWNVRNLKIYVPKKNLEAYKEKWRSPSIESIEAIKD